MNLRLFIPKDSTALALGADRVARAFAAAAERRGLALDIVRTGSRGLYWLEPLVEVGARRGARRLRTVGAGRRRRRARGDARRRRASQGSRPGRRHRLSGATAAARVRALRRDRSAVARRLCRARGRQRPTARRRDRPGRHGQGSARFRAARSRRRGLSDRDQVAHGRRRRRRSEIRRLQRRRGRQRHLRRPDADGRRPLPADRGHGDRRPRGRRDPRLRLHPLGISARLRHVFGGASSSRASGGWLGPNVLGSGKRVRPRGAARRRRLYLRRGDFAARKPGRQARPRARQAAAARDHRACSASRPSSTTC